MMKKSKKNLLLVAALAALISLPGCLTMGGEEGATPAEQPAAGIARNEPYFPTNFTDFEIPGEMKQERAKSMYINTNSFKGGVLMFSGWVEADSLTDFFINTMRKNQWKLTGEVRYENVLLAFSKPNKSCMLTIYPGKYGSKTEVYAYITEANTESENLLPAGIPRFDR